MTSTTSPGSSSFRKLVTAFFDSRSDAEDAVERLVDAGVSRDSIRFMPGDDRDPPDDPAAARRAEPQGFWGALGGWFLPDEDRHAYAEGLRRGGYLISVNASDEQYERVLDILDDEGTIDIDERANSWRAEGWSSVSTNDVFAGSTANLAASDTAVGASDTADRPAPGGEEVSSGAAERPDAGRRDLSHGRTRVRSYVVEDPSARR
jgi:hypothetical protein